MKTFFSLDDVPRHGRGRAVTIGNFDGVHRGHRSVIDQVAQLARGENLITTVVTFQPHPQKVLRGVAPSTLTPLERKIELLEDAGVEQVIVIPFNKSFSKVEPEQFINDVLVDKVRVRSLVVGQNFRFGHFARGDVSMLKAFSKRDGFLFQQVRLTHLDGRRLSSGEIRHALAGGELKWANKALGRAYVLPGRVVRGKARGKSLGFPTANVRTVPGMCIPAKGIYAGFAILAGGRRQCAISIGTNPQFGKNPLTIEGHLLDFSGDLYQKEIKLELVEYLRSERTFASVDELSRQIGKDVDKARRLLSGLEK